MTTSERAREPQARKPRKPRGVSANALTATEGAEVALTGPALSVRQLTAAKKLAIGFSQQQAADAARVDVRTIRRWLDEPDFDRLVTDLQAQTWDRIGDRLGNLFEHCLEIHFAMLRKEIDPSDPVYLEAKELIIRYGGKRALVDASAASAVQGGAAYDSADDEGAVDSTFV